MALIIFNFQAFIPHWLKVISYTLSLLIKDILVTTIPFLIIIYLSNSITNMGNRAFIFVVIIIFSVLASNLIAVTFSYFFAKSFLVSAGLDIIQNQTYDIQKLETLFDLPNITIIPTELAILIGFVSGIAIKFFNKKLWIYNLHAIKSRLDYLLKVYFIPILPVFIAGFMFKIEYENTFDLISKSYSKIFYYFVVSQLCYLALLILLFSKFNIKKAFLSFKNILPAGLTGFSTMSSAASMPVSILAAEKNTQNSNISRIIIPTTVNMHLIGTTVGMNILIIGTMLTHGMEFPDLYTYLIFAVFFCLAQFGAIAVPGGFVFKTLPLLQTYLGFSPEMAAIIASLSIIFDPIDTSINVCINVIFVSYFAKINKLISKKI